MSDVTTSTLLIILFFLLIFSAFFSATETSMMALNRYRLRHMAKSGYRPAQRVLDLLQRPDRLIGVILLANNFVNILASALTTIIALRYFENHGIAIATGIATAVILIFGEVAPKTLAILYPERIAYPTSFIIVPLLRVLYPLVWVINCIANAILRIFGVSPEKAQQSRMSSDELRTVLFEAKAILSKKHHRMIMGIMDLETANVNDIMIPRNDIMGIDINQDIKTILSQLESSQYTRLPLYRDSIDHVVGIVHLRNVMKLLAQKNLDKESLLKSAQEPYFVPEGTSLTKQLINFQKEKHRMALTVNEYGDIQGLITLEDILKEVVGEFTPDIFTTMKEINLQEDGSYWVDCSISIRDLNRAMHWQLPTDGPKTFNGFILEYLETIPEPGTSFLLEGHPIEILHASQHTIKTVKIFPIPPEKEVHKDIS